jgi:DNA-binding NtrC family response regulator
MIMAIEHAETAPGAGNKEFLVDPPFLLSGPPARSVEDSAHEDPVEIFAEYFCKRHPVHLKLLLDAIEKCLILKVLDRTSGSQKEAARILGIKYTTLNQKVRKHGIRFRRGVHLVES